MLNILMDRDIPELFILDCCSIYTLCRGMAFIASNFPLKMAYRQGGKISPILFFCISRWFAVTVTVMALD